MNERERNGGDVLSQPMGGPLPPYPGIYVSIVTAPQMGAKYMRDIAKKNHKKMPQKKAAFLYHNHSGHLFIVVNRYYKEFNPWQE